MKTKTRLSLTLALFGFGTLILLSMALMPALPKEKARATRINTVNSFKVTFPKTFVLTNGVITNQPASRPSAAH